MVTLLVGGGPYGRCGPRKQIERCVVIVDAVIGRAGIRHTNLTGNERTALADAGSDTGGALVCAPALFMLAAPFRGFVDRLYVVAYLLPWINLVRLAALD